MAPNLLKTYQLSSMELARFLELCWDNLEFYENFLIHKLKDVGVNISDWVPHEEMKHIKTRNIKCFHPSKISFPGLPSHAESLKVQTLEAVHYPNTAEGSNNAPRIQSVSVKEINSFRGIPYADYFNVITEWKISEQIDTNTNHPGCIIHVYLDFKFHKSTWLQGTIESNTKAELLEVFDLWFEAVTHQIRLAIDTRKSLSNDPDHQHAADAAVTTPRKGGDIENQAAAETHGNQEDYDDEEEEMLQRSIYETSTSDGEELQFYDCEQDYLDSARSSPTKLLKRISVDNMSSKMNSLHKDPSLSNFYDDHKAEVEKLYPPLTNIELMNRPDYSRSTPPDLKKAYHEIHEREKAKLIARLASYDEKYSSGKGLSLKSGGDWKDDDQHESEVTTTRDLAINIVESVFVLAEFIFWQIYRFYAYDLKDLFRTDLLKVHSRVINSFIPGWHIPLLHSPDLYGPLIAVFCLPQTLLLAMETARHGCNPTSQLGNTVIVSLFIWIGLSALYRLLALLVAPSIAFKHCLSVVGYSFYSWNLAILCSLPLERYKNQLEIPILLPLMIFGLPSAIAQGYMFWEHTPPSNMVLQPASLPVHLQTCASNNSRWIQRFLWALPKIVAFALVAGTHYQLLWYIARVFLPGRRQLCRLSALIQPSQYAAILSQQEIRNFALSLLSGKENET